MVQASEVLLFAAKRALGPGGDRGATNPRWREMSEALRSGADVNARKPEVSHAKQVQGEHTEHCAVKQVNILHKLVLLVSTS